MLSRIHGLLLRNLYLYRRSLPRAMQIVFWPVMELLVWGFLSMYLRQVGAPDVVQYLLGVLIFWDILYRSQQGVSLAITEEIWVRNILNIFIAPVRVSELAIATGIMGMLKSGVSAMLLIGLGALFYNYHGMGNAGFAVAPFWAAMVVFGWSVGMATTGLIVRFGHSAEALVWGVPFLLQPLSAVFYPVSVLPEWLQWIAMCLPSTHVFEGMRFALAGNGLHVAHLCWAIGLGLVWLFAGAGFFGYMVSRARHKGYLGKLGME